MLKQYQKLVIIIALLLPHATYPMHNARKAFSKFCTGIQWGVLTAPFAIGAAEKISEYATPLHPISFLPDAPEEQAAFVREILRRQQVPNHESVTIKHGLIPSPAAACKIMHRSYVIINPEAADLALAEMELLSLQQPMSKKLLTTTAVLAHEAQHLKQNVLGLKVGAGIVSPLAVQGISKIVCFPFKALWNGICNRPLNATTYSFFRSLMRIPATPIKLAAAMALFCQINQKFVEQAADDSAQLTKDELLAASDLFLKWHKEEQVALDSKRQLAIETIQKALINANPAHKNTAETAERIVATIEKTAIRIQQIYSTHPPHLERARKFWKRAQKAQ